MIARGTFICDSQNIKKKKKNPETTILSHSKWMFKSALVRPYSGIQLNNKKAEQLVWRARMGLKDFMLSENK